MNPAHSIYINDFDNFEEMSELVKAWELEFYQLSNNQFKSHLAQFLSSKFVISHSTIGCRSEHSGTTPEGFRTFAVLSNNSPPTIFRGKTADQNTLMCFPRDNTIAATAPPGFDVYTLSINTGYLHNKIHTLTGLPPNELLSDCGEALKCPELDMNKLRNCYKNFMGLITASNTMKLPIKFPLQTKEFENQVSELLVNCLVKSRGKEKSCLSKKVNQGISKSLQLINDHSIETPSIESLASTVGISQRSLEYGFAKYYGVTPKKYIKFKILNRIRGDLLSSNPNETNVVDVANRYGFWHMGQFSRDYKGLFGELPSKTLKQSLYSFA